MAHTIGSALEELARATGAVAHLYKNLEIGPNPGELRLNTRIYDQQFREIIDSISMMQNN
jgi:hypothetical protein